MKMFLRRLLFAMVMLLVGVSLAHGARLTQAEWGAEDKRCRGNLQCMLERIRTTALPIGYRTTRTADEMFMTLKAAGRFTQLGLTDAQGRVLVREVWQRIRPASSTKAPTAAISTPSPSVLAAPGYQPRPEFAPLDSILMRWPAGGFYDLVRDEFASMVKEFGAAGVKVSMWVDNKAIKKAALQYLADNNIATDHITWMVQATNSIWIRDYGPIFLYPETGDDWGLTDFHYYPSRPADDAIPAYVARVNGVFLVNRQTRAIVYIEGGNINVDGLGMVAFSQRVYEYNPRQPSSLVDLKIQSALQAPMAIVPKDPSLDGTGHVDMFMKIVDPTTVLVAQYGPDQTDYAVLEEDAALLAASTNGAGEPWNVVRIPQPDVYYVGFVLPVVRTYTNSVITNDVVIVPTYGIAEDAQALEIYEAVLPGRRIVPLNANDIIEWAGAWHCVVMEYPAPRNAP